MNAAGRLLASIRPAEERDLPAINDIYNFYVRTSTCTYQVEDETAEARLRWFRNHSALLPVFVAEREGQIVAWSSLSHYHARAGYRYTVENSIYVRDDCRRAGLGAQLLAHLVEEARRHGYHAIIAGISADQIASVELHRKFQFVEVGRLLEVGFKFDRWLDVVYLERIV